ncbi:MAG TPA: sulfite exporter TauE/SafE family protein [Clostridiaceae bacterium]|nr:sulfite exporter TauE/SafE family protein [Clostridiaceae bacterium]
MLLFIIGIISGIISGMGIGGGTVLIPALVLFTRSEQHIAQSVNLIFFIPTAIIALFIHIKNKRIDFKMALPIIIFGLAGAFIGSKLAGNLPGETLKKIFGVFLMFMGIYEVFRKGSKRKRIIKS